MEIIRLVTMKQIRLHEPNIAGNELLYVRQCLKDNWISSSGKYVEKI